MPESPTPSRVVGILGGMGPAATVDFYDKLVRATPATTDQEHLRVVIWADPTIPNRHAAILGEGEDPRPSLSRGVDALVVAGADLLVVPCNTVHAFLDEVVTGKPIEFISIIEVTVAAVLATGEAGAVGLIAADGAIASGGYQQELTDAGLQPVLPAADSQADLMRVIYRVKAGESTRADAERVSALVAELEQAGATTIIAGCTEISTMLAELETATPLIDPSEVLARVTVHRATRASA